MIPVFLRRQLDSSITNSRESTSIIMSMPPGKILLVVISRSLCECHMKAKPASDEGLLAMVPEGGVVPVVLHEVELFVPVQVPKVAREVASGPRYGLPLYQGPFVKRLGSGRVAGPPPVTSPNGFTSSG